MVGSCEQWNESLGFTKDTEFLINLTNNQLLKTSSAVQSYLLTLDIIRMS
jgi:hypothetical protein